MGKLTQSKWTLRRPFHVAAFVVCLLLALAAPVSAGDRSATSLRSKYSELEPALSNNSFRQPIHLDSTESSDQLTGDAYALVEHPYLQVHDSLGNLAGWCDILMLHINTKYCKASKDGATSILSIRVGGKYFQTLDRAYPLVFIYSPIATTPEYFAVELFAKTGPAGTHDYRIFLEAIPVRYEKTFIHLSYSYTQNFVARFAIQAYLATVGRHKVGFTEADQRPGAYIGGVRGIVERNTMRYYLAVDAYLEALSAAPDEKLEKRLQIWFAATERYPRQLHEMTVDSYMKMKMSEYSRMKRRDMVDFDNPQASGLD